MMSLMTSQRPDPLSVRTNNFPEVDDHHVKKSAQSDKNSEKKHFESSDRHPDRHPDIRTDRHKTDFKGR